MKYSILLPYFNRDSLKSSLISFFHHYYDRSDFEVVIVEDVANNENPDYHTHLLKLIDEFKGKLNIHLCLDSYKSFNPTKKFNTGFKNSSGQFIILSSPEIFHEVNILKGLDEEFEKDKNNYIICSCQSVAFKNQVIEKFEDYKECTRIQWYQHSKGLNRLLHFCSSLSRENFIHVGGFDEQYSEGIAYDDDSFRERILVNKIPIILRDDLVTLHIEHSRQYVADHQHLYARNEELWKAQLSSNDFFKKYV